MCYEATGHAITFGPDLLDAEIDASESSLEHTRFRTYRTAIMRVIHAGRTMADEVRRENLRHHGRRIRHIAALVEYATNQLYG
jgi:hypothetical protein